MGRRLCPRRRARSRGDGRHNGRAAVGNQRSAGPVFRKVPRISLRLRTPEPGRRPVGHRGTPDDAVTRDDAPAARVAGHGSVIT